jgi:hypothetical protein
VCDLARVRARGARNALPDVPTMACAFPLGLPLPPVKATRTGFKLSKNHCLFMAAAGRGRSGPLPVMAGVAVVLLALLVGADARAGGSHVTWAVRNGAAPPLSVRACLLFGSQHHPRAGAIAREPGACGCVPTCRAGTLL